MRRLLTIAAVAVATMVGADQASADSRLPRQAPMVRKMPGVKPPNVIIIPPSAALSSAMGAMPGAKALGVKMKGTHYIVKLKQGNTVVQVRVNAATGLIAP